MKSKPSYLLRAVVMAILLANNATPLLAQNATGSIRGLVKDQQEATIVNAGATATNKATGAVRTMNAGNDGIFVFENLLPGQYEVKVEATGFATQTQILLVEVGSTTTSNFSMTVGAVTDIVDVAAGAPVLNKDDTVVGGTINRERIENLPLNGRSFLSAAALEPGVSVQYASSSGAGNPNAYFQVS